MAASSPASPPAAAAAPVASPASAVRGQTIPGQPVPDDPRYRLYEGTFIDTVLTNRLDGTFTGPVNCLVSVPVYAADQRHLVIPAGAHGPAPRHQEVQSERRDQQPDRIALQRQRHDFGGTLTDEEYAQRLKALERAVRWKIPARARLRQS